jgi:hypothetical protein
MGKLPCMAGYDTTVLLVVAVFLPQLTLITSVPGSILK